MIGYISTSLLCYFLTYTPHPILDVLRIYSTFDHRRPWGSADIETAKAGLSAERPICQVGTHQSRRSSSWSTARVPDPSPLGGQKTGTLLGPGIPLPPDPRSALTCSVLTKTPPPGGTLGIYFGFSSSPSAPSDVHARPQSLPHPARSRVFSFLLVPVPPPLLLLIQHQAQHVKPKLRELKTHLSELGSGFMPQHV